jgi:HSP20 family molecular chaperone IbpA
VLGDACRDAETWRLDPRKPAERQQGGIHISDVKETKDAYLFKADLPGIDVDKLRALLDQGVLTITVPKTPEVQPKKIAVKTESATPKS